MPRLRFLTDADVDGCGLAASARQPALFMTGCRMSLNPFFWSVVALDAALFLGLLVSLLVQPGGSAMAAGRWASPSSSSRR